MSERRGGDFSLRISSLFPLTPSVRPRPSSPVVAEKAASDHVHAQLSSQPPRSADRAMASALRPRPLSGWWYARRRSCPPRGKRQRPERSWPGQAGGASHSSHRQARSAGRIRPTHWCARRPVRPAGGRAVPLAWSPAGRHGASPRAERDRSPPRTPPCTPRKGLLCLARASSYTHRPAARRISTRRRVA